MERLSLEAEFEKNGLPQEITEHQLNQSPTLVSQTCSSSQMLDLRSSQVYFPIPILLLSYLLHFDDKKLTAGCKLLYLYLLRWAHYYNNFDKKRNKNLNKKRTSYRYSQVLINIARNLGFCPRTTKNHLLTLQRLGFIRLGDLKTERYLDCVNCVIDVRLPKKILSAIEKQLLHPLITQGEPPRQELIEAREQGPECTARQFVAFMNARDALIIQMPSSLISSLCADSRISEQAKLMHIYMFDQSCNNKSFELCTSSVQLGNAININKSAKPSKFLNQLLNNGYLERHGKKTFRVRFPSAHIKKVLTNTTRRLATIHTLKPSYTNNEKPELKITKGTVLKKSGQIFPKVPFFSPISNLNCILKNNTSYLKTLSQLDDPKLVQIFLKYFLNKNLRQDEEQNKAMMKDLFVLALNADTSHPCTPAEIQLGLSLELNLCGLEPETFKQCAAKLTQKENQCWNHFAYFSTRLREVLEKHLKYDDISETKPIAIDEPEAQMPEQISKQDKPKQVTKTQPSETNQATSLIDVQELLSFESSVMFKNLFEFRYAHQGKQDSLSASDLECYNHIDAILKTSFSCSTSIGWTEVPNIGALEELNQGKPNGFAIEFFDKKNALYARLKAAFKSKVKSVEAPVALAKPSLSVNNAPVATEIDVDDLNFIKNELIHMKKNGFIKGEAAKLKLNVLVEQVACHSQHYIVKNISKYAEKYYGLSEQQKRTYAARDLAFSWIYDGTFKPNYWQKAQSLKWQAESSYFKQLELNTSLDALVA